MAIARGRKRRPVEGSQSRKVWFFALLLLSIVLLIIGRKDSHVVQSMRQQVTDVAAPVLELMAGPIDSVRRLASQVGSYTYLSDEVARLRGENEDLRAWQARATELQGTLRRYEELLNASHEPAISFVTARVIADARGPFVRTVIVNAGSEQGVREQQAVMDGRGLVGRTISAGAEASRVLLVTDLNSRIPVRIEPQGYRAILTGTNQTEPRLDFLPAHATLQDGNVVYTSGDGGQLPPGLPVGVVSIDGAGAPRVEPYAEPGQLRFVRIFDYQPSLAIDAQAELADGVAEEAVTETAAGASALASEAVASGSDNVTAEAE